MLVIVEAGHLPGSDSGATGGPLPPTEAIVSGQIARALAALSGNGVSYAPKRRYGRNDGGLVRWLNDYRLRARKGTVDVMLSIHLDSAGPTRRGLAAYYWRNDPDLARCIASHNLALCISDCAAGRVLRAPYLRRTARGDVPFTPGVLVRTAKIACCLIEVENIANPQCEAEMMATEWAGKRAAVIDCGVRRWLDERRDL